MTRKDRCYECGEAMNSVSNHMASAAWFRLADLMMSMENSPNPKFHDILRLMKEVSVQSTTLEHL